MTRPLDIVAPTPAVPLDPRAYKRGLSCVHCGLCLPACPTYVETGHEADSPRGRIQLMMGLADGRIGLTASAQRHLDLCLDCRGCETACPSGVVYHELLEDYRSRSSSIAPVPARSRLVRWLFCHVLTRPARLKFAILPARILQKLGIYSLLRAIGAFRVLPGPLRKMAEMLPRDGSLWPRGLPEQFSTGGTKQVAFFEGCIGSVIFDRVNRQSAELLAASGAAVKVPAAQTCCGAMHHHSGDHAHAASLARQNIDAMQSAEMIVTNIAGCGSMLREYDVLLRDDPAYATRAREFSAKVRDISEALLELGPPAPAHRVEETITYHDACHLAHAQKVTTPPRALLGLIPGLKIVPLPESDLCCGAAGSYNLCEPEMAARLADRKLANITLTGATICAAGNVGCAMHIESQARSRGQDLRVVHTIELLHRAVFGNAK